MVTASDGGVALLAGLLRKLPQLRQILGSEKSASKIRIIQGLYKGYIGVI